jgi:hypothetical protein
VIRSAWIVPGGARNFLLIQYVPTSVLEHLLGS